VGGVAAARACVYACTRLQKIGTGLGSFLLGLAGGDPGVPVGGAANARGGARLAEDLAVAQRATPLLESLRRTGRLPDNYVTKQKASAAGWAPGKALGNYVPGGQLGGDVFREPSKIGLPTGKGRVWYEADVGLSPTMGRNKQPGWRLLYSNDGLAYITPDHYGRVYKISDWK